MSIGNRLYRGELGYDFIGRRRTWYIASAVFVAICLISMIFRGFNFGIEFEGGNSFQVPGTEQQLPAAEAAVNQAGVQVGSAQVVGQNTILLRTAEISNQTATEVSADIAAALNIDATQISNSAVSAQWGGDITRKALQANIVFLVAVAIFIAIRFQPKMAVAALAALVNDLIVAAGVYSLVGFEVTPSTVIGLLTILGFSLYDTVVVFDKVDENTRGILGGSRTTYSEAANLAVNQTLMRSINTSLIALLPVAGLLFVGAGLLGAGTLKDLALVLFVGLASGAYSSIFLATPILCDLKEREPAYVALAKRVQARRSSGRGSDTEPARPARPARRQGKTGAKAAAGTAAATKASAGTVATKKVPAGTVATKKAPAGKVATKKAPAGKAAATKASATKAGAKAPAGKGPTGKPSAGTASAGTASAGKPSAGTAGRVTAVVTAPGTTSLNKAEPGKTGSTGDASTLRPSARRVRSSVPSARRSRSADTDTNTAGSDIDAGSDIVSDMDADTRQEILADDLLDDDIDDDMLDDETGDGPTDSAVGEDGGAATASGRPAGRSGGKAGQRGRTGRPAGKSNPRRGRPSGKRKR